MKPKSLAICLSVAALLQFGAAAESPPAEKPFDVTVAGVTYKNCQVLKLTPSEVKVMHSDGIAKLKLSKLPAELQKRFKYDPAKEAEAAKQAEDAARKEELEKLRIQTLAAEQERRLAKKPKPAPKVAPAAPSAPPPVGANSSLGRSTSDFEKEKQSIGSNGK